MKTQQSFVAILVVAFLVTTGGTQLMAAETPRETATATLGGGCFWCIEAVFEEMAGVLDAESGYAGGNDDNPDYRAVCSGESGHAEVVNVVFDPAVISFEEILLVFFGVHDPTTLNRQGADVGTQYRSIILYHDEAQHEAAQSIIGDLERDRVFDKPIVTEVVEMGAYYPAEPYHQDYFASNPTQGYCQVVIAPKLAKFREQYGDKLK